MVEIGKEFFPLPWIYMDCNSATIDVAAIAVARKVEELILGVESPYEHKGNHIYGFCNHPNRHVTELNNPRNTSWDLRVFSGDVQSAITCLQDKGCTGPFLVCLSSDWQKWGVMPKHVEFFDCLPPIVSKILPSGTVVVVEVNPKNITPYIGCDVTLVQSPKENGGNLSPDMKILCKLFSFISSERCGIVHATVQ
jgi:hypothetical protein